MPAISEAPLTIRPYTSADQPAFQSLNEDWIRALFALEPHDIEQLSDPETHILSGGGAILLAEQDGIVVGTCALVAMEEGTFEVAKMAVNPALRGAGIGRKLLQAAVEAARARQARRLYIETNNTLSNAVHLYESCGFIHIPVERRQPSPYARGNVFMERFL